MPEETAAILSDLHAPYHDEAAIEAALSVLQAAQPDLLIFAGDVLDCKPLSRFDKSPLDVLTLQADLAAAKAVMQKFRQALPETHFQFIAGNHEARLEKWLWKHPEVSVLECLRLQNLLDLDAIDCDLVEDGYLIWHDWLVTHGDLVRSNAGNTAQAMLAKWGANLVHGHTHRLAMVSKTNHSRTLTGIENGCLCQLTPDYIAGTPDWQQGFTCLTFADGRGWPELIPIRDGEARYQGLTFPTNS